LSKVLSDDEIALVVGHAARLLTDEQVAKDSIFFASVTCLSLFSLLIIFSLGDASHAWMCDTPGGRIPGKGRQPVPARRVAGPAQAGPDGRAKDGAGGGRSIWACKSGWWRAAFVRAAFIRAALLHTISDSRQTHSPHFNHFV
jgi:hypothetical protein